MFGLHSSFMLLALLVGTSLFIDVTQGVGRNLSSARAAGQGQASPPQLDLPVTLGALATTQGSSSWQVTLSGSLPAPYKFNSKAPWQVQLVDDVGIIESAAHFTWTKRDFVATVSPNGTLDRRPQRASVTAFVCDEAETWCRRQVVTLDLGKAWSNAQKQSKIAALKTAPAAPTKPQGPRALTASAKGSDLWGTLPPTVTDKSSLTAWSKTLDRPVLLYWGATWCPPCNELKERVFHHSDFERLTSTVQRIHIDGDAPQAQQLGEVLRVSGYPTLVLLLPGGAEGGRLVESLSYQEFAETLTAALDGPEALSVRLDRALAGRAMAKDWIVLSRTRWDAEAGWLDSGPCKAQETLSQLSDKAPLGSSFRHSLALSALSMVDSCAEEPIPKTLTASLSNLFGSSPSSHQELSPQQALGLRAGLLGGWRQVPRLTTQMAEAEHKNLRRAWLAALKTLATMPSSAGVSATERMAAWEILVLVEKEDRGSVSASTENALMAAINQELAVATTPYARRAFVTTASHLMGEVSRYQDAEKLLRRELAKAPQDWQQYLLSALASLESKRGRQTEALVLSGQAQTIATGRASRLQWAVSDLLRTLKDQPQPSDVQTKLSTVYNIAFELQDPFYGRNHRRMKSLQSELLKLNDSQIFADVVAQFAARCVVFKEAEQQSRCQEHFEPLASKLSSLPRAP